jgi:hypothetical protein
VQIKKTFFFLLYTIHIMYLNAKKIVLLLKNWRLVK